MQLGTTQDKLKAVGVETVAVVNTIDPEHLYFSIFGLCSFYFTNTYTLSAAVGRDLSRPEAVRKRKAEIVRLILASLRP